MIPDSAVKFFKSTVHAAGMNETVGLIEARHKPTGEIHYLLIGMRETRDGEEVEIYPFARLLVGNEGVDLYDPPDPDSASGFDGDGIKIKVNRG